MDAYECHTPHTYDAVYIHACMHDAVYMHACMRAYIIHACMHLRVHNCIFARVHVTCIHS